MRYKGIEYEKQCYVDFFSFGIVSKKKEAHLLKITPFSSRNSTQETWKNIVKEKTYSKQGGIYYIPSHIQYNNESYPVTSIAHHAFSHDRYFLETIGTTLGIPETVKTIKNEAFWISKIKNIVGCKGLTHINNKAFECSKLESIELGDKLIHIGKGGFSLTNLKEIKLPPKIKKINEDTFNECCSLKHIDLPKNLTTIEKGSFYKVGLDRIFIPYSVTTIKNDAFYSENKLNVYCERPEDYYSRKITCDEQERYSFKWNSAHFFDSFSFPEEDNIL